MLRRLIPAMVVTVALLAPTSADAAFLPVKKARIAIKRYASGYYYPARTYVQLCRRRDPSRVLCRVVAFYSDGYCSSWFLARKTYRITVYGPLLERC